MSGRSSHCIAVNRIRLTRAALEAVISGKMRAHAVFGESWAEEPARRGEQSFRLSRWAEARVRPPAGTCPEGHDVRHVFQDEPGCVCAPRPSPRFNAPGTQCRPTAVVPGAEFVAVCGRDRPSRPTACWSRLGRRPVTCGWWSFRVGHKRRGRLMHIKQRAEIPPPQSACQARARPRSPALPSPRSSLHP